MGKRKRKPGREITFRPCTEADRELLYQIYARTRAPEFAAASWTAEQLEQFLRGQFEQQHLDYHRRFPRADFDLILQGGAPIGRRYLDRGPAEYRLLDLALLASGHEGELWWKCLSAVIAEADAVGVPVAFQALHDDPKLPVYAGLGFARVPGEGNELRQTLRRTPAARAAEGG